MSSILDAVNKDAERAGRAPLGSDAAAGHGGGGNSPRPRRILPALAVVLVGLAVGALAARMFGGAEGEPESLLTDKVAGRIAASQEGADRAVPDAKVAKKSRRQADSAAAAAAGGVAAGREHRTRAAAGSHKKGKASRQEHRAAAKAAKKALAAKAEAPAAGNVVAAAPPASAPVVKPGALTPAAVAALPPTAPAVEEAPAQEAAVEAAPGEEAAVEAPATEVVSADEVPSEEALPQEPSIEEPSAQEAAAIVDDTVIETPLSELAEADVLVSEKPPGAPEVVLMFILWARNPDERMASIRVGSSSITIIHEGQFLEGMQVSSIRADAVDFLWTGSTFRVHVRPF